MSAAFSKIAKGLHRRLESYLDRRSRHSEAEKHECRRPEGHGQYTQGEGRGEHSRAGETEALAALLADLGHQNTVEPLLMLEVFLSSGEHLAAGDFVLKLKERGHEVSVEKASGTLELFTSLGFAAKNFAEDGKPIYEHTRPGCTMIILFAAAVAALWNSTGRMLTV